MNLQPTLAWLLVATWLFTSCAWASEGHEHGDAVPAAAAEALPRFTAESESFELVGVLSGRQVTLYLDRYADNSPVRGAQIELDIGGTKFRAEKHGDDEYKVVLADAPPAGVLAITATVTADNEVDLLAGELDIHQAAHADEVADTRPWMTFAGWTAAGIAAVLLLAWGGHRWFETRRLRTGGAA